MSMGNVQEIFENPEAQPVEIQLLYAAEYGDIECLRNVLKRCTSSEAFNIDVTKNSLWTPLFMAAKQGHADCVRLLLDAGAQVDGINENKAAWTPLWVATYAGHEKCVELLLCKGAKLEAKYPETPLFVAAREGRLQCLEMLIKAGARLNVSDSLGRMPIHIAAMDDLPDVARKLAQAGCKVDIADSQGYTPLILSCFYAGGELLEILLKSGADHSKTFSSDACNGYTPLHICSSKTKTVCIRKLWKYGADFFAQSGDGLQPQEITPDDSCKELIISLQGTIRSLKEICRLKVRQIIPVSVITGLAKTAGIPEHLVSYLKFEN